MDPFQILAWIEGVIMSDLELKGKVVAGEATDIEWSAYEDFSSFPIGTEIETGKHYICPSDMGFRVGNEAGPSFPPDGHITSEGGQHALSVQLGSLEQGPDSNIIVFEFGMALTTDVRSVGVSINSKFAGVTLVFFMMVFFPDSPNPHFGRRVSVNFNSVEG